MQFCELAWAPVQVTRLECLQRAFPEMNMLVRVFHGCGVVSVWGEKGRRMENLDFLTWSAVMKREPMRRARC